jgi:hypothetical protein
MPLYRQIAVLVTLAGFAGPALAQDALANRFRMEKSENGIVRLDTVTGAMALCVERDGALACTPADGAGPEGEAANPDLQGRIDALEKRIEALEAGAVAKADRMPDDAEIDKAVGVMEKFMRSFFGMVDELRKDFDLDKQAPSEPSPQRT